MSANKMPKPDTRGIYPTVQRMVYAAGMAHASKTAVICHHTRLTYAALFRRVRNLAAGFMSLGLQQGDRITLISYNCHRILELDMLAYLYGYVICPVHPKASPVAWEQGIREHGAKAVVIAPSLAGTLINQQPDFEKQIRLVSWDTPDIRHVDYEHLAETNGYPTLPSLDPEDPVSLNLTSGTTGASKAVIHTQGTWAASAGNVLQYFAPIEPDDVMLHVGPMTHSSSTFIVPFLVQGGCAVIEQDFDPDRIAHRARLGQAGRFQIFPPMFRDLLEHNGCRRDLPGQVRIIEYGGSPSDTTILLEAMDAFGTVLEQGYGQTETMPPVTVMLPEEHTSDHLLTAGRIIPGVTLNILDFEGNPLPADAIGEVAVSGGNVTPGYWNNPDETRKHRINGYWLTGDRGFLSPEGWLTLHDRQTDIIIRRGFNIAPKEVEAAARAFPGVTEAVAFAVPHPQDGEAVALAVVAPGDDTIPNETLANHIATQVSEYARPDTILNIEAIPRNANGKVMRETLKHRFWKNKSRNING